MIELSGYAILPSGNTIQDYSDLISYLENGEACITGGSWELEEHMLKSIKLFPLEYLDDLIQLQRATGIYANDLRTKELREITWSNIYNTAIPNSNSRMLFHEFKPKTYNIKIWLLSTPAHTIFSHGKREIITTLTWVNFIKWFLQIPLKNTHVLQERTFSITWLNWEQNVLWHLTHQKNSEKDTQTHAENINSSSLIYQHLMKSRTLLKTTYTFSLVRIALNTF